jgi:hypothetical protein
MEHSFKNRKAYLLLSELCKDCVRTPVKETGILQVPERVTFEIGLTSLIATSSSVLIFLPKQ